MKWYDARINGEIFRRHPQLEPWHNSEHIAGSNGQLANRVVAALVRDEAVTERSLIVRVKMRQLGLPGSRELRGQGDKQFNPGNWEPTDVFDNQFESHGIADKSVRRHPPLGVQPY